MKLFWKRNGARNKAIEELKKLDEDASVVFVAKQEQGFTLHASEEMGPDEAIGMLFIALTNLAQPKKKEEHTNAN